MKILVYIRIAVVIAIVIINLFSDKIFRKKSLWKLFFIISIGLISLSFFLETIF